ncbi:MULTISPECIES: heavy metal sensor histidine kinase [Pasteurellaceae]|uniref:Sensor protein n=1 Tax=Actinobacillus indolicus TaxID=51049 RepID=A0A4P7CKU6_9PAST|nr:MULTISPECIES: heavy metal sensor histidine kinase [Pasteurellaceae]MDG2943831.1 heavy metal sensor histidine kinase [Exercitatus varius]MDG2946978.1 heavy metal sensor histidine kinase [Exercitatus varius]QBQ64594.1 heavy metal sensor histidine kinase [Actinobacillus indolicus]QOF68049.1 heavy metal sensor histidine kinase [Actinobacillus sp. GY-402]
MMYKRSLTFRLSALFAIVMVSLLSLLGFFGFSALEQHFQQLDQNELNNKVRLIQQEISHTAVDELMTVLNKQIARYTSTSDLVIYYNQAEFAHSKNVSSIPANIQKDIQQTQDISMLLEWEKDAHTLRGVAFSATTLDKIVLQGILFSSTGHHLLFMQNIKISFVIFVLILSGIGSILGYLSVRSTLKPLQKVQALANKITGKKLNLRLELTDIPIELQSVVEGINQMLAKLNDEFQRLSVFSSDLAHEFRTPINNMLTQTQVTLSQKRENKQYIDILSSNAEELERLARTISDMLFLAKNENGQYIKEKQLVNLSQEITALFAFFEFVAEEKQVKLLLKGSGELYGNALMLRRAISNLLSNALQYANRQSEIVVEIQEQKQQLILSVYNQGEPIPAEDLPHLFNRFYRVEKSRTRQSAKDNGTGLGLAITKSIVNAHNGEVSIMSDQTGTKITMSFYKA